MKCSPTLSLAAAAVTLLAATAFAQTKKHLVIFSHRYNCKTADNKAAATELGKFRSFDITGVVPGQGATAFSMLPGSSLNGIIGDVDGDGIRLNFEGQMNGVANDGISVFMRHKDKAHPRADLIFWTVTEHYKQQASRSAAEQIQVKVKGKPYLMRSGDYVRILPNGEAEFFITQDQFMKAIGKQTGAHAKGGQALCQAPDGTLYFAPNHIAKIGGGVRVMGQGATGTWVNDASVLYIPAKAITYDAKGNVKDVQPKSARIAFKEAGVGPTGQPSTRMLVQNSGWVDSVGVIGSITFWMGGIEIDPAGGTWNDYYDPKYKHPHLIFHSETSPYGSQGSYASTIFSTRNYKGQPGTIATINGVLMGTRTGKADASWIGLNKDTGLKAGSKDRRPMIRGLILADAKGLSSTAPQGIPAAEASGDGVVYFTKSRNFTIDFQGPVRRFPLFVFFDAAADKGKTPVGIDLSSLFGGYGVFNALRFGPFVWPTPTVTDASGHAQAAITLPNNTTLIGQAFWFQPLFLAPPQGFHLGTPAIVEVR
ncbi:MAG: hypothetical protein CSA62_01765 [Planctomycetota bacterium]|nr:MAG: hypothetical protein CSA62_01765 [Planctomycetota bacterium]